MDTQKLGHVLAVVEHGTFSAAARAVHLTQSALSRSIQSLEDELRVPLFDRAGRRAHLTVFGQAVVERARRLRIEETELRRSLDLLRGGQEGSLRIGLAPAPTALLLAPFLAHMAGTRPGVRVRAQSQSTEELLRQLRDERIDAIVGDAWVLEQADDVELTPLGQLRAGVACRTGHPILRLPHVDLDALRAYPVASTTLSEQIVRILLDALGPGTGVHDLVSLHCDNLDVLREVALSTDTLLFAVLSITRSERAAGRMAEVPLPPQPRLVGRYALARLAARSMSPALAELYSFASARWRELAVEPEPTPRPLAAAPR